MIPICKRLIAFGIMPHGNSVFSATDLFSLKEIFGLLAIGGQSEQVFSF
jgi:hypothetical protein